MKFNTFTIFIFSLIFQFELIGQNFEIVRTGEHGFGRDGNTFFYKLEMDVKNNTNLKLKRTKFCASINQLYELRNCSSKIYDSIWYPESVVKFVMFLSSTNVSEYSFDRTPNDILLSIKIKAHNIDKDFNDFIRKFDIKEDWKDFQTILGLRDFEPGDKLKFIKPPVIEKTSDRIYDPYDPMSIGREFPPSAEFIEKYKTDKSTKELYKSYVNKGIYAPLGIKELRRQVIKLSMPKYGGIYSGLVEVEVIVNREGKAIEARIKSPLNRRNKPKKEFNNFVRAALESQFVPSPNAPEHETTIIEYKVNYYR